jgi:hypothetical protein
MEDLFIMSFREKFNVLKKSRLPSVMVIVPNTGSIKTKTVAWMLLNAMGRQDKEGVKTKFSLPMSPFPADHNRNTGIESFLNDRKMEWAFFLDSDVEPPLQAIDLLISNGKKVVSGLYPAIISNQDGSMGIKMSAGHLRESVSGKSRIDFLEYVPKEAIEADVGGAGCLMVHREVIEKVVERFGACFKFKYKGGFIRDGEDVDFLLKVKDLGYKLYIDPNVFCGHKHELDLTEAFEIFLDRVETVKRVIHDGCKEDPELIKTISELIDRVFSGSIEDI